jgi:acylphosphatase
MKRAPVRERWRIEVRGRVQGVGYRAACHDRATGLGLGGWVRNRPDGTVELEAEGPPPLLQELSGWCERGPAAARVEGIHVARVPVTGCDWFEIRR